MLIDPRVQESAERVRTCRRAIESQAASLLAKFSRGEVIIVGGGDELDTIRALLIASESAARDFRDAVTEH